MKKNVITNYLYNSIYQILTIILPLITAPYISRVLGATNIGIYSFTTSISAYFIMFGSLGIASYGRREIAYIQDKKKEYSKIFYEINIFRLLSMSISLILFFVIFVLRNNDYTIYYKILSLEILATCFDISWFFQGLEEFKKIVIRNIVIKMLSIISIFMFVKSQNDIVIYFIIYSLSTLLGNVSLWLNISKYITKVNIKEIKIFKHFIPTIALFIPQIAIQIYTVLDKIMIGAIIPDKSISGYYEQAQKIVKILLTLITSLGTVMLPRIANNYAKGDNEKIKQYLYKSFSFVYFLSFPMIMGLILISNIFVPIFFGPGYDSVSKLIIIISPILLMIGLSNVIGMQYLLPTKHQKEYTLSVVGGAIINFIINLLLIDKYGAIGASIGTVIAETTVTFIQFIFVRKEFNFTYIMRLSFKYLISSIIMFIICYPVRLIIVNSFLQLFITIILGGIIYVLILFILKDEFINMISMKLVKVLKMKRR